jgi:hypothetical protein
MITIQPCRVRKPYRCSCVPNKSDRRCARTACLGCGIHGLKPVGGSKRIKGPSNLVYWKTMTFATKKERALGSRGMPRGGNVSRGDGSPLCVGWGSESSRLPERWPLVRSDKCVLGVVAGGFKTPTPPSRRDTFESPFAPSHRTPNLFGLPDSIMAPVPKTTRSPDSRPRTPGEAERSYSFYYLYNPATSPHKYPPTPKAPNEHYVDYMDPWQDVTYAFSWVQEQQIEDMMKENQETVEWVLKQQQRFVRDQVSQALDDVYRCFEMDMDTESWLAQAREESARRARRGARREAEMAKLLQREGEKRKKEHEEKRRKAKAVVKAWKGYEKRWARISGNTGESLSFAMIPWPTVTRPTDSTGITKDNIRELLLSRHHSKDVSNKDRVRTALKLWHPDKFKRILDRVEDKDRAVVEEAAGAVARCLNGIMEDIQTSR